MRISIKLFAAARQIAGAERLDVDLPDDATVGQARAALIGACPALEALVRHAMFAVDREYRADTCRLGSAAEVACIPPVSGG